MQNFTLSIKERFEQISSLVRFTLVRVGGPSELSVAANEIPMRPQMPWCTMRFVVWALVVLFLVNGSEQSRAGTITAWGYDYYGQVRNAPTGSDFTTLASYGFGGIALRSNGSIAVWGDDTFGQVTNAPTSGVYKAIAGGSAHLLALRSDGSIISWGNPQFGALSGIPSGTGFKAIAAGDYSNYALAADGSIVA